MADKDFLSQFSENNKPASFKEEERIPVSNNGKKINIKVLLIALAALIIVAAVLFIIFFMPKIKVEDFTGLKKEDAVAWIRQQEIESSGIIFKEEYNFDNEKGIVLSQDPASGKVSKDAKMTFVVSSGPDPDEKVSIPDFSSMDKEQINTWINQNKLLSTKLNTTYSDEVEKDQFIKADYSGCDEDTFTRGCTLKISISKGAKPQEEITMLNFVKKTFAEFETWANGKKLKLNKTESYSDTIESGLIISQSVRENEKVVAGDTINVVVSKGKAVYAKNFIGTASEEVSYWASKNGVYLITKEEYNDDYSKGEVISQSIEAGNIVTDEFTIIVSLGNPELPASITTLEELRAWKDQVNEKGADLHTGDVSYINSDDVEVGRIISISSTRVGSNLNPVISSGRNIWLETIYTDENGNTYQWSEVNNYDEDAVRKLCELAGVSYKVEYEKDKTGVVPAHYVISVKRDNNNDVVAETYISQSEEVIVTVSTGN